MFFSSSKQHHGYAGTSASIKRGSGIYVYTLNASEFNANERLAFSIAAISSSTQEQFSQFLLKRHVISEDHVPFFYEIVLKPSVDQNLCTSPSPTSVCFVLADALNHAFDPLSLSSL